MKKNILLLICLYFAFFSHAQQTLLSTGGDGNGSGGTFSFSFGQFAYETYFNGNSSEEQGVQHAFEIFFIPSTNQLSDSVISSGEIACFDALQNLTVAGDGSSVVISENATSDFIAGSSIHILPGFHAQSGSFVHAFISTNGNFCDGSVVESIVVATIDEKSTVWEIDDDIEVELMQEKGIKIYPNPNKGVFKVDLLNFERLPVLQVYNIQGESLFKAKLEDCLQNQINISTLKSGIYFVQVIGDNVQVVKKILIER